MGIKASCVEQCKQVEQSQQPQYTLRRFPRGESSIIQSDVNLTNHLQQTNEQIISSMIRKIPPSEHIIKIKLLNSNYETKQMSLPTDFEQQNEEQREGNYHIFSAKLLERIANDQIAQKRVQIFIVTNLNEQTNIIQVSIFIFCGLYENERKKCGIYFTFSKQDSFVFIGEFKQEENIGLKVSLNQNNLTKHWGHFNLQFDAEGAGRQFKENGQYYEYHQGNYIKGMKNGEGILKMKKKTKDDQSLVNPSQKQIKCLQIKRLKRYLNQIQSEVDIKSQTIKLISKFSKYDPSFRTISFKDNQCELIFESSWSLGKMEGFTKQIWPQRHFRFEGMFKNNQRNGYGEEYIYNNIRMKGFYHGGTIENYKNSQQLIGFRLNQNEQWIRQSQKI